MIRILYIGQYKKNGKFTGVQWGYFIEWCKVECNKLIVYSQMPYSIIKTKFPRYCNIDELEKPDKILNIFAYEINVINVLFWNYVEDYNYNINIADDISHIFFLYGKRNVASLEIVDYENYVLIEEPINSENKFLSNKKMLLENIQFCVDGKYDIDSIVQEEDWKPLGLA